MLAHWVKTIWAKGGGVSPSWGPTKSCFLNNLSLDHNNITFAIFYNLPESLSAASPKNWFPNNIWFPADERDSGRMISSGDRSSKNTHFHSMCSVLKHFKTWNPPKILFIQYVQCWSSGSISKCEILKIWSQCFYQVLRHSKNATVLEIWLEQGIYTGGGGSFWSQCLKLQIILAVLILSETALVILRRTYHDKWPWIVDDFIFRR